MSVETCPMGLVWCNCQSEPEVQVEAAPKTSWIKDWLIVGSLSIMVLLAVFGATVIYDRVANPTEDSGNVLLNCYAYGDGDCGPNAPWHGYINLFDLF